MGFTKKTACLCFFLPPLVWRVIKTFPVWKKKTKLQLLPSFKQQVLFFVCVACCLCLLGASMRNLCSACVNDLSCLCAQWVSGSSSPCKINTSTRKQEYLYVLRTTYKNNVRIEFEQVWSSQVYQCNILHLCECFLMHQNCCRFNAVLFQWKCNFKVSMGNIIFNRLH